MPKLPHWYLRAPEILAQLRAPGAPPFLDRSAVETLFRVGRRQAIRLLGAAQGYQVGKTFLVEREALIDFVSGQERSGAAPEARARKRRVLAALNEVANAAAAQQARIPVRPDTFRRQPEAPAGIELIGPGRLQIRFRGAEDLLAQLAELAAAAANDFPAFRKRYEGRE